MKKRLVLPALRGSMGDWIFYVCLFKLMDLTERVSMVDEIHKNKELSRLIQRTVSNRTSGIVEYLTSQPQRFFNSIILGIYGGHPSWREIQIEKKQNNFEEEVI